MSKTMRDHIIETQCSKCLHYSECHLIDNLVKVGKFLESKTQTQKEFEWVTICFGCKNFMSRNFTNVKSTGKAGDLYEDNYRY